MSVSDGLVARCGPDLDHTHAHTASLRHQALSPFRCNPIITTAQIVYSVELIQHRLCIVGWRRPSDPLTKLSSCRGTAVCQFFSAMVSEFAQIKGGWERGVWGWGSGGTCFGQKQQGTS